ncbi:ATP-dependent DNA ligase [Paenibacillus sp. MMO-177]|uniref:ATP-dependent DNA ligase n=1 Tax=Paenibacillus sp. MMO-177 TaxID=3081289 RepID=UPI0030158F39
MYGKSLEIPAMKAWKLPKGKEHMKDTVANSGDYFGQIKKDGYWYMFEKDADGNCFLFSRVPSVETGHLSEKSANVPHIIQFLDSKLPNSTIIIGEIYYPYGTSKDVTKIMGCLPEKAVERQNGEHGLIHYYMHDIIMLSGEDLTKKTNLERYTLLEWLVADRALVVPDFMEFAYSIRRNLNYEIDHALESGEEGMILKKVDGLYVPNKKPAWNWIKFKIEDDHDVICTGYEQPTKEYKGEEYETWQYWLDENTGKLVAPNEMSITPSREAIQLGYLPVSEPYAKGWIGAIRIGAMKDAKIVDIGTVSSGLSHAICEEIKANPDKFIGQPIAVKCMMVGDGALRHPVFVRWRDDIPVQDCTWEKIFE